MSTPAARKIAVYLVTNTLNSKKYVGITLNFKSRMADHKSANTKNSLLHAAIKKHGVENFIFTHIADAFEWSHACEIEKMLIIEYQSKKPNGYNLTDGGEGTLGVAPWNKGKKHSDESIKKMKLAHFGKKASEESKKKQSVALKGIKKTQEHKEKIGNSQKGITCPQRGRKGKTLSEETKQKISAARIAKFALLKAKELV